jgi:hypothetical protein
LEIKPVESHRHISKLIDLLVRGAPPLLLIKRLGRLCRNSRRGHFWLPLELIQYLFVRHMNAPGAVDEPKLRLVARRSDKRAPALGERLRPGAAYGNSDQFETTDNTVLRGVRALTRQHELRHQSRDSLRARFIPTSLPDQLRAFVCIAHATLEINERLMKSLPAMHRSAALVAQPSLPE